MADLTISSWRTTGAKSPPLASMHARTMQSTIRSTASRHVPINSSGAAGSTNVLPSLPRVRAGSIGSALNAAKLVVPAAASVWPPCTIGGGGGAVLESRRERRVWVDARAMSGGGRRFVDDDDDGGGDEAAAEARRSALRGGREADAVRLGETLGRAVGVIPREERGLCMAGEVLVPPVVNLLVLGVSRDTTYGPVGEVGISTLLRKE